MTLRVRELAWWSVCAGPASVLCSSPPCDSLMCVPWPIALPHISGKYLVFFFYPLDFTFVWCGVRTEFGGKRTRRGSAT